MLRWRGEALLRGLAVIAALHWAQSFLVPIAITLVVGLTLAPLVDRARRLGVPRSIANVAAVLLCMAALTGVGWLITSQMGRMAAKLPEYKEPILRRMHSLGAGGGVLADAFSRFEEALGKGSPAPAAPAEGKPAVPAAKSSAGGSPLDILKNLAMTLLGTLGNVIIILVLLSFFLSNREDLRARILRFFHARGMPLTGTCLDAAAGKVSRYVLTEGVVNAVYGAAIGGGTLLLGVPHPFFWGLLAALFRFIPYVGTWLVAAMAFVLSLSLSLSWTQPLLLLGFWLVLELVTADVLEPLIYGRKTGMTAVGVMVSALFWSWLWGIPGLVIATPLTAALVELGSELPPLQWLHGIFTAELPHGDPGKSKPHPAPTTS